MQRPPLMQIVRRAAHWRCPNCGRGRLFRGVFRMLPRCPECGLSYFPEQGYYVGAMIINYVATTAVVVAIFLLSRAVSGFHHAFDQFQNSALDGFCDRFVLAARAALLQLLARNRFLDQAQTAGRPLDGKILAAFS